MSLFPKKSPASLGSFQGNAQACQSSIGSALILIVGALVAVYRILGMLYESVIHHHRLNHCRRRARRAADPDAVRHAARRHRRRIILLISIVKKSGILLVDFALERERARLSSEDFIHEACRLRFRPILMTTLCALLGGAPLMVGTGTGREIRQPFGYAIVGDCADARSFPEPLPSVLTRRGRQTVKPVRSRPRLSSLLMMWSAMPQGRDTQRMCVRTGRIQASAIWNGDRVSTRR
jgi:hypothetical protein